MESAYPFVQTAELYQGWFRRLRVWLAKRLLRTTTHMAVSRVEVECVDQLCGELEEYLHKSGGFNSLPRIHARKKIGYRSDRIVEMVKHLRGEEQ